MYLSNFWAADIALALRCDEAIDLGPDLWPADGIPAAPEYTLPDRLLWTLPLIFEEA